MDENVKATPDPVYPSDVAICSECHARVFSFGPLMTAHEQEHHAGTSVPFYRSGLTKREYFAACALQGMLANAKRWEWANDPPGDELNRQQQEIADAYAAEAVRSADALLAALARAPLTSGID